MNPAALSILLGSLFPPGTVAAELRGMGDSRLLLAAEAIHVGRAVPKRVQEFAAGRLCARRALAEFGIVDFPIKMADDRQPVWPHTVVGSITHTAGFAAAVVAERRSAVALGLDTEVVGEVHADLWPSICVPAETAWLEALPEPERAAAATLIFSAKEAFYKCQYPLMGERLNFQDVSVEAAEWGGSSGPFRIHAVRSIAARACKALSVDGQYAYHDGLVTAGMGLAAAADAL
jgi:4'-phosphopantetheinyl transferase EntD